MIGTTPEMIKVPKGAVFIRVNKYLPAFFGEKHTRYIAYFKKMTFKSHP